MELQIWHWLAMGGALGLLARFVSAKVKQKYSEPWPEDTLSIQSFSEPGVSYKLSPSAVRCSCPDWKKMRANLPHSSPCRACKHLSAVYTEEESLIPEQLRAYLPFFQMVALNGIYMPHSSNANFLIVDSSAVIIGDQSKDNWVNIFVDGHRYGLNIAEHRFSYGRAPQIYDEIIPQAYAAHGKKMSLDSFHQLCPHELPAGKLPDWDERLNESWLDLLGDTPPDWMCPKKESSYYSVGGPSEFCRIYFRRRKPERITARNKLIVPVSENFSTSQENLISFRNAYLSYIEKMLPKKINLKRINLTNDENVVTTEEEAEAFYHVQTILFPLLPPDRIILADRKTFCNVLLDGKTAFPLCRFRFDKEQKYIGLFAEDKKELRRPITFPEEIKQFAEEIRNTARNYLT